MGTLRTRPLINTERSLVIKRMVDLDLSMKELADEIGIHVTNLSKVLAECPEQRLGLSEKMRLQLDVALKLEPCTLARPPVCAEPNARMVDLKNYLTDLHISEALQNRGKEPPPTFFSAISASFPVQISSISEKQEKQRHFIQPSIICRLRWPGASEHLLVRMRKPRLRQLKDSTTQGLSILIAGSYRCCENTPTLIDEWITRNGEEAHGAESELCEGDSCLLAGILAYKILLPRCSMGRGPFTPFGIVTGARGGNFYSQFVFEVTVDFASPPKRGKLARWSMDGALFSMEELASDPAEKCVDDEASPLQMDIAVWKALKELARDQIEEGAAVFRRGFSIV